MIARSQRLDAQERSRKMARKTLVATNDEDILTNLMGALTLKGGASLTDN